MRANAEIYLIGHSAKTKFRADCNNNNVHEQMTQSILVVNIVVNVDHVETHAYQEQGYKYILLHALSSAS